MSARITFEVSVSTKALLAEARQRMTKARGASVSDDELLMALAAAVLGTPARDEGLSSYKQREAQGMIDGVATHVGDDAEVMDVLRAAMRAAPLPTGCVVREERAVYERIAA